MSASSVPRETCERCGELRVVEVVDGIKEILVGRRPPNLRDDAWNARIHAAPRGDVRWCRGCRSVLGTGQTELPLNAPKGRAA
jgi:hypothetical protein